jgi:hypothetical protein
MRRLRPGEWLAGAGGVALLVSLTLEWYWVTGGVVDPGFALDGPTGFESFSILDLYLVLVAALGIALAVLQATQRSPGLPVGAGVLTTVLGAVAVLLVAYRMVNQPGSNEFIEVRAGAWVGLLAALAVTLGAWLSLHDEREPGLPPGPEPELRPPPA